MRMARGGKSTSFQQASKTQSKKQTIANNKNNTREGEVSTRKRYGMTKQQRKVRNDKPQQVATMQNKGNAPQ
jgi:hypothetical protein